MYSCIMEPMPEESYTVSQNLSLELLFHIAISSSVIENVQLYNETYA
jgi:hypothetical protein